MSKSKEESTVQILGLCYEKLLARAFKFDKRIRRAGKMEYINLVKAQRGDSPSNLPKFEKQMEDLKIRMSKAFDIFIKNSSNEDQITSLKQLQSKVIQIQCCDDINEIIESGLNITKVESLR